MFRWLFAGSWRSARSPGQVWRLKRFRINKKGWNKPFIHLIRRVQCQSHSRFSLMAALQTHQLPALHILTWRQLLILTPSVYVSRLYSVRDVMLEFKCRSFILFTILSLYPVIRSDCWKENQMMSVFCLQPVKDEDWHAFLTLKSKRPWIKTKKDADNVKTEHAAIL